MILVYEIEKGFRKIDVSLSIVREIEFVFNDEWRLEDDLLIRINRLEGIFFYEKRRDESKFGKMMKF